MMAVIFPVLLQILFRRKIASSLLQRLDVKKM